MPMYRVRTELSAPQGGPYLSTMFFNEATGTAQQAATAVITWWQAVDNLMANDYTWTVLPEVAVIQETSGLLTSIESVTGNTGVGIDGSDVLPPANQILVRWLSASVVNGRLLRGRTFVPGLTEAANTERKVSAAWITALDTANAALLATANADLVVWHRPSTPGGSDGELASVSAASVWTDFAVLRSRRD